MLAIPIEESILFIEPLYLKAESSEMPELKRVIVAFSDKIVMEKDLPAALERLFSGTVFIDAGSLTEGSLEIAAQGPGGPRDEPLQPGGCKHARGELDEVR